MVFTLLVWYHLRVRSKVPQNSDSVNATSNTNVAPDQKTVVDIVSQKHGVDVIFSSFPFGYLRKI